MLRVGERGSKPCRQGWRGSPHCGGGRPAPAGCEARLSDCVRRCGAAVAVRDANGELCVRELPRTNSAFQSSQASVTLADFTSRDLYNYVTIQLVSSLLLLELNLLQTKAIIFVWARKNVSHTVTFIFIALEISFQQGTTNMCESFYALFVCLWL